MLSPLFPYFGFVGGGWIEPPLSIRLLTFPAWSWFKMQDQLPFSFWSSLTQGLAFLELSSVFIPSILIGVFIGMLLSFALTRITRNG